MKVMSLRVGVIGTNCYIVYDESTHDGAVIDPGGEAGRIEEILRENQIQLSVILLTHGHFDHILGVYELAAQTGAKVVIHEADAYRLRAEELFAYKPYLQNEYQEKLADQTVQDGDEITFGSLTARYIHTPGHTEGSCLIAIEDCLFTGDTLFRGEIGRCDLPGGDYATMLRSLKKINALEGNYTVYPGHEGFSTLEKEKEKNPYLRKVVQS